MLEINLATITPNQAKEWLATAAANRNISTPLVRDYASAITNGRWRVNGETIKLDRAGRLIDGQHRLHACVMANKSFKALVATGVDHDTFDTIDVGRRRTAGDILGMDGIKYANATAGMIRLLLAYEAGKAITSMSSHRVMPDEIRQRVDEEPTTNDSVIKASAATNGLIPPAVAGFLYHLFRQKNQAQTEVFFHDLQAGTGLKADDPVWKLRERLLRHSRINKKLSRMDIMLMMVRAWNARRTGQPLIILKGVTRGETGTTKFPTVR